MQLFYNLSLRSKITLIIAGVVALVLTTGFSLHLYSEIKLMKERVLSEKTLIANIVGNYSATDIIFNNKDTALESLSYLKEYPSVINAHLFDETGRHYISLHNHDHDHSNDFGHDYKGTWHNFEGDNLNILEPIIIDDSKIGSIYLHTSIEDNLKLIKDRILFLSLFLIALVLLATLIAKQLSKVISQPILSLADTATNFTKNKNYELTLKSKNKDETGQLVNAFNEMLLEINKREKENTAVNKKLKEGEHNLKLILDNMVDAVITIDDTGLITTFNNSAEDMFGYTLDEVINKNINILMPEPYAGEHDNYLKHYLQTGERKIIGIDREVTGKHKNNETFPMRLAVAELPIDSNGRRRFTGTCQNLTQAKQQEQLLRRTQKMDALGKLTGGVAHDYNNMLGVITGYAELLESALSNDPRLSKYAHEIHHAGQRGAKLTKKLLSFSREKQADEDLVNLNALLNDEQHMLEKTLTVRIKLILDLDDNLWPTWLDINDLEDAILNMSINAMHAIEDNGQLSLKTQNEKVNTIDAKQLGLKPGDYITLCICDTGCGMNAGTREKIFDPFYSTKGDKGTGLGLSQVYGFVKRSGGAIKVYSEPGHGTRFILYFPRYNKISTNNKQEEINDTEELQGNETILVVDDEPALIALSTEILEQHGYHVICAENAKQAIQMLEQEPVDLLLSDIIMPGMDGYQLADFVRKQYPEIRIQLASGFTDNRHIKIIDDDLHRNLLYKPFNSHDLLQKIRELLE